MRLRTYLCLSFSMLAAGCGNNGSPSTAASFSGAVQSAALPASAVQAAFTKVADKQVILNVINKIGVMSPAQYYAWTGGLKTFSSLSIAGIDLTPAVRKAGAADDSSIAALAAHGATMAKIWKLAGAKWQVPNLSEYESDLKAVAAWGNGSFDNLKSARPSASAAAPAPRATPAVAGKRPSFGLGVADCAASFANPNAADCPYAQQAMACDGAIIGGVVLSIAGAAAAPIIGGVVAGAVGGAESTAATTAQVVAAVLPSEAGGSAAGVSAAGASGWAASTGTTTAATAAGSQLKTAAGCSSDLLSKQLNCVYPNQDAITNAFNCQPDGLDQEVAMAQME